VASSLPGRGRGLITRIPSTAPLSRLLCAYFVAQRIDEDDGERVFRALRVESAGRAADQVTSDDKAMLFALCHDLDVLVAPLPVALLQSFERAQQHATHNCLLGLCIDAIKAFLTWHMEDCPVASQRVLAAYRDHTKAVFAAICAGDRGAAITAEAAKFAAIQQTRFGHRAGGGRGRPKHLTRQ
jgi:hypothetical protein